MMSSFPPVNGDDGLCQLCQRPQDVVDPELCQVVVKVLRAVERELAQRGVQGGGGVPVEMEHDLIGWINTR